MQKLKDKILKEGTLRENNILKVDSFLNHQIDIDFMNEIGVEFKNRFSNVIVDKIVTVEASGIAIASIVSQHFGNVPVVFAKKTESKNLDNEVYKSKVYSYTKGREYDIMIAKKYISENENILILDDFLANGAAALGLIDLLRQAKANIVGVGIVIEKSFQVGAERIISEGLRLESLARIKSLDGSIEFK
ncbi:xanthine phosphoribosyltransferase [Streptobacillus felis]|uniref:xanthine phosphoribosyltransferase n=1 Tax=Streptobacillus felis TaxID=1384509 RepID=UPI00082B969A|nr:xanthine phosphoribosyltransferase [Streptobacillus felis]